MSSISDTTKELADLMILLNEVKDSFNTHQANQVCEFCQKIGCQHKDTKECEISNVIDS